MCKSWTLRYTCSHTRSVRRRRCGGNFSGPSRHSDEAKIRCRGSDPLIIAISSLCASCRLAEVEAQLHAEVEMLRIKLASDVWNPDIAAKLVMAESELGDKLWSLTRELPSGGAFKESVRPLLSRRSIVASSNTGEHTFRSSRLGSEIKPEDVLDNEAVKWDWSLGPSTDENATELENTEEDEDRADWGWDSPEMDPIPEGEQDLEIQLANLTLVHPLEERQRSAGGTENVRPRKQVIPPHRRRREGSSLRGRAQQAILDLRSLHACGGYQLGFAISN
ncbi:unnamed protein product [Zymoseptoria tritici ST99CH_3D1]|uniref:Uncharacterized protein n=1 Tax=Zymoseptoria tritici (strain CBS 115943 / IPO323) TaxID=336722 RepID=F9X5Q0_ZYMTI|nr:uncharacterized protein MYCGRDRAFT_91755 [Zymoseptoria tritici IPO323]EGP88837.1 hypothetical protein MYCGRDRAFT_91755 [Zymoseptoria tritici IPO323]SMR49893.1 unnamed protein product [Zymoseptoria tritici ST99CH_3D1]